MAFYIEKTSDNNLTHSGDQQNNENLPFGIDWSLPHQDTSKHTNQNSDDDGKSHHFHFEHFTHRRRDILFHAFARFILLLSFISSLISGFFMWNC